MLSCAVIGCGAAGMAASTALRQSGLLVTCFELAADPGGVWSSDSRSPFSSRGLVSPIYPTLRSPLPKDLIGFSDVRFDYTVPQFPHHSSIRRYLEQYAERKGVRALTRFNTKVQSVRFDKRSAVWRIITVNVINGDIFEWTFDRVCVCTGLTHEPRYPIGLRDCLADFTAAGGELHHASHIKDFRQFKGKRIVVVGDGLTAHDYCRELFRGGAEVYHSTSFALQGSGSSSIYGKADEFDESRVGLRDALGAAVQLLSRTPGWRADVTRGTHALSRLFRPRGNSLSRHVGALTSAEGRGILFADLPATAAEKIAEAKTRALSRDRRGADGVGTFVDGIDAVVSATGYAARYPFLDAELRAVMEQSPPPLRLATSSSTPTDGLCGISGDGSAVAAGRGLYLGTICARCPTMAFVGAQRGLTPPGLLLEAQAKFVAYAFTGRVELPREEKGLAAREVELTERYPLLQGLHAPRGLGLQSAVYFNVLQEELQVGSRQTYTASIMERQKWFLATTLLRLVHTARSMAPLKRKKQHLLFSNEI